MGRPGRAPGRSRWNPGAGEFADETTGPPRPGLRAVLSAAVVAAVGTILAVAGCQGADPGPPVVVQDSAGVTVIHTQTPAWADRDGWRLAEEPRVEIGAADGPPDLLFSQIAGVFRLSDGAIVVANWSSPPEIRVFSPEGEHVRSLGNQGQGPGEFLMVARAGSTAGDTLVAFDYAHSRITLFQADGALVDTRTMQSIGDEAAREWVPWGMFGDGTLLMRRNRMFDPEAGDVGRQPTTILRVDHQGEILSTFGPFPGPEYDARNPDHRRLVRFGLREAWHAHGERLYVGSGDEFRIRVYDLEGNLLRTFGRAYERPRVTRADLERELERMIGTRPDPIQAERTRRTWNALAAADRFPAHGTRIVVGADGQVWVEHYHPPESGERRWSVFDPEGRWLGEVSVPEELQLWWVDDEEMVGVWTDEMDVPTVRVYPLVRVPA